MAQTSSQWPLRLSPSKETRLRIEGETTWSAPLTECRCERGPLAYQLLDRQIQCKTNKGPPTTSSRRCDEPPYPTAVPFLLELSCFAHLPPIPRSFPHPIPTAAALKLSRPTATAATVLYDSVSVGAAAAAVVVKDNFGLGGFSGAADAGAALADQPHLLAAAAVAAFVFWRTKVSGRRAVTLCNNKRRKQ